MTVTHALTGRVWYPKLTSRREELSGISAWYGRHRCVHKDREDTSTKEQVPGPQPAGTAPSGRISISLLGRGVLISSPIAFASVGELVRRFVAGACHDPPGFA